MKLNNEQRAIALGQFQAGRRVADVAAQFNVVPRTIRNLHARFAQTSHVKDRPRSGRPKVTTPRQDNFIRNYTLRNRFATSKEVNQALQNAAPAGRQRISDKTVRRRLHEHGIKSRRPIIKQVLTQRHKAARLQWSVAHQHWRLNQWRNVLFSDEVRICLRHIDRRRKVWRRVGEEHHEKTSYGGGSIMSWAGISGNGKTALVEINGNLNSQRYINEIIVPHIQPFAQRVGQQFIF
jgi:transposase